MANTPTFAGLPINVVWMGGDRHVNGYCSPENNPLGPFPVWLGSGVSGHALQQRAGEVFDFSYGFSNLNIIPVMQYLQGVLSDDGLGKITLSGLSREVHDTWNFSSGTMTDPATWVMSDGGSASDTWVYPV